MNRFEKQLLELEPGDPVRYSLFDNLKETSNHQYIIEPIYSDSAGFLEKWVIDGKAEIVIDNLNGSQPMIRTTSKLEEVLSERTN